MDNMKKLLMLFMIMGLITITGCVEQPQQEENVTDNDTTTVDCSVDIDNPLCEQDEEEIDCSEGSEDYRCGEAEVDCSILPDHPTGQVRDRQGLQKVQHFFQSLNFALVFKI